PDTGRSQSGAGGFGQRVILRGDDLGDRQVAGYGGRDREVHDGADPEGDHDRTAGVAVGILDLAAAVGDGGEALVGEDGQRNRGEEACGRTVDGSGGAVGEVVGGGEPQPGDGEAAETEDLDGGHDSL